LSAKIIVLSKSDETGQYLWGEEKSPLIVIQSQDTTTMVKYNIYGSFCLFVCLLVCCCCCCCCCFFFCLFYMYTPSIDNISLILRWLPVKIRVRIDPPHFLVCRKRRLNGAVLRTRPEKPRSRVTAGVAR
jgi:hypothetical protein